MVDLASGPVEVLAHPVRLIDGVLQGSRNPAHTLGVAGHADVALHDFGVARARRAARVRQRAVDLAAARAANLAEGHRGTDRWVRRGWRGGLPSGQAWAR